MSSKSLRAWALERPLDEIAIELTLYCNLSCAMCSVWRGRRHGIPSALAREALRDARSLGAKTFTPCGAETFMRRDALELLEFADDLGFRKVNVVTNSLVLNAAMLDRLARLPSVHLNVSIDGPRDIHDSLRGPGAFDRALKALGELRDREISFALSTVLMRQTLSHVEKVIELASSLDVDEVSLQPYQPEIGGPETDHDVFRFAPSDEEMLSERLLSIAEFADRHGVKLFTKHLLDHVPAYLVRGVRPIPAGGCFVPSRFVLIDASGAAYPCFFMRERSIGNVFQNSLGELWHSEVQRELNLLALEERCPGCLAACSDVATYDALARGES